MSARQRWVIDCVRHGACEGPGDMLRGRTDVALTAAGLKAVSDSLKQLPRPDRLITSPLQRCCLPARQVAESWQLPLIDEPRVQEMDFGEWDGQSMSMLFQHAPEALERFWQDAERYPPPGGEAWSAFQQRISDAWSALVTSPPGHSVVVTHAGVIKTWIAQVLGVPLDTTTAHIGRIALPYGGVARFVIDAFDGYPPTSQLAYLGVPGQPLSLDTPWA